MNHPCTGKTDLFFSPDKSDQRLAIALCETCSFKQQCYTIGMVVTAGQPRTPNNNELGIWGGVNMKSEHARLKKVRYRAKYGTDAKRKAMASA